MTKGNKKSRVTERSVSLHDATAVVFATTDTATAAAGRNKCTGGRECEGDQGKLTNCSASHKTNKQKKKRKETPARDVNPLLWIEEDKEIPSSNIDRDDSSHIRMSDHGWSGDTQTPRINLSAVGHHCWTNEGIDERRKEVAPHSQRKCSIIPAALSHHGKHHAHCRFRCFLRDLKRFRALKILQILLSVYIMVMTFADFGHWGGMRDSETGFIIDESTERIEEGLILHEGDERAITASSTFQLLCIGLARLSAWFMYPSEYNCIVSTMLLLCTISSLPISCFCFDIL